MARKRNRIRLGLDIRNPLDGSMDVFAGQNPRMPRARALQVEIAVFDGTLLDDISDILSMTLEVKATVAGVPLMSKTLAAAAMVPGLKLDAWNAGTDSDSHAMFTFLESETGLDLAGAASANFVLVVTALTSIGNITLGTATLTCVNDGGLTSATTPAAGDPAYLRVDQFNALAANFVKVNGDPGVPVILNSKNGKFKRRLGISDLGVKTDDESRVA